MRRLMISWVGHAKAYDFMFSLLHHQDVSEADILRLQFLFYSQIDEARAGVYRQEPVFISGSSHPVTAPEDIPQAMRAFCSWLRGERKRLPPVEQAALAHQKFVFIHPFIDGNGRVARLLMKTADECGLDSERLAACGHSADTAGRVYPSAGEGS